MKYKNTEMLGSLQSKIMDILWETKKPLKPSEVLEKLGNGYAYTTVMTILKRLNDKEVVSREMAGKVYLYSPCLCKEKFIGNNLSGIIGGLVDSYGKVAIANFVDVVKNNKEDMALLKKYLKSQK